MNGPILDRDAANQLGWLIVDWNGRSPGFVECCAGCGVPLEVIAGQHRVGAALYHLEPDLFCDECVAAVRPDLAELGAA